MQKILSDYEVVFADQIRSCRMKLGLSQQEVADKVHISQSLYNKWERKSVSVQVRHVDKLQSILDIPYIVAETYKLKKKGISPYSAKSFADLIVEGIPEKEVFDAAYDLFDEDPPAEIPPGEPGSNDFGKDSKWERFIKNHPDSFYLILHKPSNTYIAVWHVLSITTELYDKGYDGENINKDCTDKDILGFNISSNHRLYFVDLFRRKLHNNPAANGLIMTSFLDYLFQLAKHGHYIEKILTHASTVEAEDICEKAGFQEITDHNEHKRYEGADSKKLVPTKIYELDLQNNSGKLLAQHPVLHERYLNHFGSI